jgi:hypothetical protein
MHSWFYVIILVPNAKMAHCLFYLNLVIFKNEKIKKQRAIANAQTTITPQNQPQAKLHNTSYNIKMLSSVCYAALIYFVVITGIM